MDVFTRVLDVRMEHLELELLRLKSGVVKCKQFPNDEGMDHYDPVARKVKITQESNQQGYCHGDLTIQALSNFLFLKEWNQQGYYHRDLTIQALSNFLIRRYKSLDLVRTEA
ncbi:unnamed protein product [Dovyalis caffra]|uniref:Uncharacterized protein n=1 Tax=Dovyalis caffra TaxID=77055 RepID=A0AAV1RIN9_9ROSI|nr:unnamed protein product [Dovyalis caffra]